MRRRLALLVTATTTLVLLAFLLPLALLIRSAAADQAASRATIEAQALVPVVATGDRTALTLAVDETAARSGQPVTVYLPDGTVVGEQAPPTNGVRLAALGNSITVERPDGREILIAVGQPAGTAVIRTVVPDTALSRGVHRAWLILALLGVVLIGIGIVVADRLARTLVGEITGLADVSHRLAGGDLDTRVPPSGPPEIRAVAGALNHLAGRIQHLVVAEREAVADVSHRLRTPLTALRLDAEALADPDDAERLGAHVDALDRAVTAVIDDVRRRGAEPGSCDAAAVVAQRAAFWQVLAEDQDRSMRVDLAPGPLPVRVAPADLAACLDALLGNVFSHTPDGTGFSVRLTAGPDGAVLVVADRGPGFVGGTPVRRGVSGAGSTGLGLDIAEQTARRSGGRLVLGDADPHGAVVTVELPLIPPLGSP
ncbi:signal transduction histidine kinase [Allocatelliglobosispora scoriae]|uniref:histidine kinase n=1 Tax=Allocatelliglobosispora scoriae TaxID=643052 RepID=A0A841C2U8_9ACTN|nr:HAMP domain-containing sensor histidine kinase [Allocatelliglobosispora scoriae]MBB5874235.1 signal transduction histidine kinase [Allocatelliglobosispora scoriae]